MIHRIQHGRHAFTLLEVILSLAISMILLGSLYVAMNIQMRNVQAGRDLVEESTVARALLNRMASDISRSLGPVDPVAVVTLNGTTAWTQTSTTGTTTTTGAAQPAATTTTPTTGGTGGGASGGAATGNQKNVPPANAAVSFNPGLQGDGESVTLYVARDLRDMGVASYAATGGTESNNGMVLTDLRQVIYKLGDGGVGLQRLETVLVMPQDLSGNNVVDPTTPDPSESAQPHTLAEEVDSLQFQYFDPQAGWVENWPQDATNYDGVTPIGPPLAIKITLHIKSKFAQSSGDDEGHTYTQVVAIPTANAAILQTPPVPAGSASANPPLSQQQ